jgi:dynein heavy chain, axonemal
LHIIRFVQISLIIFFVILQKFFKNAKSIPFDALHYLISECFYGGRVTDGNDRKLIASLLPTFLSPAVVEAEEYANHKIILSSYFM